MKNCARAACLGWLLGLLAGCATNPAPSASAVQAVRAEVATARPESPPPAPVATPVIDTQHPPVRPQIVKQPQVRPAIFAENKFGASKIGNVAVDAKWSSYGAYLQRMIETVQLEWDKLLTESKNYPSSGTYVSVKFALNAEGKITRMIEVDNHSTEQGSRACVSAIINRAPFGQWTDDMKAVLGERQEMTFTFYYR